MADESLPAPLVPRALAYPILVGLPAVGIAAVLRLGAALPVPTTHWGAPGAGAASVQASAVVLRLGSFIAQIIVIIALSRMLGRALRRFGQPFVVGEMLAGILLGPSILGAIAPVTYGALFPPGSVRFLSGVSQLGLLLFMFHVGLQLKPEELRGRGHAAVLASHVSIVMPLFFGAALALLVYTRIGVPGVGFSGFALFLGAAMSVTAFPVLARMLGERGLRGTPLGALALACAAVDDVSAWCVLAVVVAIARTQVSAIGLVTTLGGAALYAAVMLFGVRPRLRWLAERHRAAGHVTQDLLAIVVLTALGSAWLTEQLGIHALFGAFMAGVVMPKDEVFVRDAGQPFEAVLTVVLLPLFFAATGIRTSFALISGAGMWGIFALVVIIAVAGKLGGSAVAARVTGLSWRESLSLGVLMNTRGLMGLVILQVGVEIGVVSPPLFAMMVLMSIVTTMMASPGLAILERWPRRRLEAVTAT